MSHSAGIDFGTSNCTVSIWDDGVRVLPLGADRPAEWGFAGFDQLVPSVFGQQDGDRMFGWNAKQLRSGNLQAVKRLLAGNTHMDLANRTYSCRHVAALLFGNLRSGAAQQGVDVTSAVVTIPANSAGQARFRTRLAARMAGIQVKALINEPTAAAMAYLAEFPDVERLFVYDWGGGTIDATLLELRNGVYRERASRGIAGLGGIEIDRRLEELVVAAMPEAALYRGEDAAALSLELERTKIRLSSAADPDEEIPFSSPDGRHQIGITRRAFEQAVDFLIEKTMDPVRRALDDVGLEPLDVDAVLMVGGSSQMPRVRERLADFMETTPVASEVFDPMTAVSKGAAIAAAALDDRIKTRFKVMAGHSLGTKATLGDGTTQFSEVIRRGSALPSKSAKAYTPNADFERKLRLEIWEGDPDRPFDDPENVMLGALNVVIEPPRPRKEAEMLIEYRYDLDGILHITVTDKASGKVMLKGNDFFDGAADEIDPEVRDVDGTFAPSEAGKPDLKPAAPSPSAMPRQRQAGPGADRFTGRTVVVDGSNLACVGRDLKAGHKPSYGQLRDALGHLTKSFPSARIVVVVDANLRHKLESDDKNALLADVASGAVLEPPAGTVGAGDALVLAIAEATEALVVTNDSFKEWQQDFPWIRQGRILGAQQAAGGWFFLPRTPPAAQSAGPAAAPKAASAPSAARVQAMSTALLPPRPDLPVDWDRSHWWSGE